MATHTSAAKKVSVRESYRERMLKKLGKKTSNARKPLHDDSDAEESNQDEYISRFASDAEKGGEKEKSTHSLVASLPKPKHSSSFGPSVELGKLLQMPKLIDMKDLTRAQEATKSAHSIGSDGILEVNVAKFVSDDASDQNQLKNLSKESATTASSSVSVPRGKERQKNQITYIASLGKATELERKEKAAQAHANKAAARAKYGW